MSFIVKECRGVGALISISRTRWFSSRLLFTKQMYSVCTVGHKSGFGFKQSLHTVILTEKEIKDVFPCIY